MVGTQLCLRADQGKWLVGNAQLGMCGMRQLVKERIKQLTVQRVRGLLGGSSLAILILQANDQIWQMKPMVGILLPNFLVAVKESNGDAIRDTSLSHPLIIGPLKIGTALSVQTENF
jgi:hypothetical protein